MIVPLTGEEEWLTSLADLPSWQPPSQPVLIVAPHPDDETLATGGFIAAQRARGIPVIVAAVTDGEASYPDSPQLSAVRRHEQTQALARLGVDEAAIVRLGLPDSAVASQEERLCLLLKSLISPGTHVLAPWPGDFHPDHEASGRAAQKVAKDTGALLTFYFFWTWHRGTPATLHGLSLQAFPLDDGLLQAKTEALLCHHSQLVRPDCEPILPEYLLAPARRHFEVFAA